MTVLTFSVRASQISPDTPLLAVGVRCTAVHLGAGFTKEMQPYAASCIGRGELQNLRRGFDSRRRLTTTKNCARAPGALQVASPRDAELHQGA
jgi:hypothetical protein